MKYYSEITHELYEDKKALLDAEKLFVANSTTDAPKEPADHVETDPKAVTPTRKELAALVETADEVVKKAYTDYELAKKRAEELSAAYLKEIEDILQPAKKQIKEAEQARYEAIKKFNESFGPYQTAYTGARAAEELVRALNDLNLYNSRFFRNFFGI